MELEGAWEGWGKVAERKAWEAPLAIDSCGN